MEVNRDILPPLVFTCGQCYRILSDSQEFICSIEDIELIVMKGRGESLLQKSDWLFKVQL